MKFIHKLFSSFLLLSILNVYGQNTGNVWKDYIDFKKLTPKEYFEKLKISSAKYDPKQTYLLTISSQSPEYWITKNDVEFLMYYIDSEQPSYCVMQFVSSYLPINEKATFGGQAMNLIDSYRLNKGYPYILTDCSKNDETRSEEIKKWWNLIK